MDVWSFPNSRSPSFFKVLNFQTAVTFGTNVRLTQFIFWIFVFFRYLLENVIHLPRIPFYLPHRISTRIRNSKTRFLEKRHAQTAFRQFGCVDLEKIRGFNKKIAWNGRPRPELWPFEVSQIQSHLRSLRCWISNGRNFRLERPFDAIFFLNPCIFSRSIWITHRDYFNFLLFFSSYFDSYKNQ